MQRIVIQGGRTPPSFWFVPFGFGLVLILTGIAIAVMPELLVAMVAGLFVLAGLAMVGIAFRLRSMGGGFPPGGGFPGGGPTSPFGGA